MSHLLARARRSEGFTLIEMVITLSIISISFTALSYVLVSALDAYASARLRSSFVEIANAEIEALRAQAWGEVGVRNTDPNLSTAYPSGEFDGRDAVVIGSAAAPTAVSVVTTSTVEDISLPYTIRRWITWTDPSDGTTHVLKRLTVQLEWRDEAATRSFRLVSLRYPGGFGETGPPNTDPVADFTVSPTVLTQGGTVALDGTASLDTDGDTLTYEWNFGDGQTLTGPSTTSHLYTTAGHVTIQLTVRDTNGGTNAMLKDIVVISSSGNAPPTAAISFAPAAGIAPLSVNFDGSGSTDPNGAADIFSYSWNWGDGTAAGSGISATHTYSSAGTFTAVLTVTDAGGLTDTASGQVVVSPLLCDVTDGYLKNPESNSVKNDVRVDNNGRPDSRSFTFFATSNGACTSLTGKISHSDGILNIPLSLQTDSGGLRTWKGTGSVGGSDSFPFGLNQTGEIRGSVPSSSDEIFAFAFNVQN